MLSYSTVYIYYYYLIRFGGGGPVFSPSFLVIRVKKRENSV